jgi:hypothetical protein
MIIILIIFCLSFLTCPVNAIFNPLDYPNNKYGIHIADVNDLDEAAKLVNSNGGDWGYITVVIPDNDRNLSKWQTIFDRMRKLHLIPLVRIASHTEIDYWTAPNQGEVSNWVNFLNLLKWPTANRYVILYNEPNHAKEWGGKVDPENYAQIAAEFVEQLKNTANNFYILPAGLDVSAANDGLTMDAAIFLDRVNQAQPDLLSQFDGWNSHSYPNPGFSGSPNASGRGSLNSYVWELNQLKNLGINKDFPIFITETGWMHSQGENISNSLLSPDTVGNYFKIASENAWTDPRIVAITPFLFNYQGLPFDHFSFKMLNSNNYYSQYFAYQNISKIKGEPKQIQYYRLDQKIIPDKLVAGSKYYLKAKITNLGQNILDPADGYKLKVEFTQGNFIIKTNAVPLIEPNQIGEISLFFNTPKDPGSYEIKVYIGRNSDWSLIEAEKLLIVPSPSIDLEVKLGWKSDIHIQNLTLLIYDDHEFLIHKISGLTLNNHNLIINNLNNIIPGNKYRIVLLAPDYLPRQTIAILKENQNNIKLLRLYPLDFDHDGAFTINDIWSIMLISPLQMVKHIF